MVECLWSQGGWLHKGTKQPFDFSGSTHVHLTLRRTGEEEEGIKGHTKGQDQEHGRRLEQKRHLELKTPEGEECLCTTAPGGRSGTLPVYYLLLAHGWGGSGLMAGVQQAPVIGEDRPASSLVTHLFYFGLLKRGIPSSIRVSKSVEDQRRGSCSSRGCPQEHGEDTWVMIQ